jgi:CRP-like cAMP-binding protein
MYRTRTQFTKALSKKSWSGWPIAKPRGLCARAKRFYRRREHQRVFCVKDGVCKMTKLSSNGRDQIVHLVKKGELLANGL